MKIVNLKRIPAYGLTPPSTVHEIQCLCGKLFDVDVYMQLVMCPSCGKMQTKRSIEAESKISFTSTRRE